MYTLMKTSQGIINIIGDKINNRKLAFSFQSCRKSSKQKQKAEVSSLDFS